VNWLRAVGYEGGVPCVRDMEDFVGVRKETKFSSERRLYSLPEYKTLHEEEERKTRGAYSCTDKANNLGTPSVNRKSHFRLLHRGESSTEAPSCNGFSSESSGDSAKGVR